MTDTTDAAKPPLDMNIPETFHRLKRTIMLLSAALLALGVAHGTADQTLNVTMTNVKLPPDVVRWLLVGGAIYYLAGFVMEVRVVRMLNSDLMFGRGMKSVDAAFVQIGTSLEGWNQKLSTVSERVDFHIDRMALLNPVRVAPQEVINAAADQAKQIMKSDTPTFLSDPSYRASLEAILNTWSQREAENATLVASILKELSADVKAHTASGEDLSDRLKSIGSKLKTLSSRISGDRTASFYVWEVGGAVSIFVIATAFNAAELTRGAADLWFYLFPIATA